MPKKAVFGHFCLEPIEQKLPYVRYLFSNYVEFTVCLVLLCQIMLNFLQNTVHLVFFNDFRPFFLVATCRQISAILFYGKHCQHFQTLSPTAFKSAVRTVTFPDWLLIKQQICLFFGQKTAEKKYQTHEGKVAPKFLE